MPGAVANRTYRAWGKYRITELFSETSYGNSVSGAPVNDPLADDRYLLSSQTELFVNPYVILPVLISNLLRVEDLHTRDF